MLNGAKAGRYAAVTRERFPTRSQLVWGREQMLARNDVDANCEKNLNARVEIAVLSLQSGREQGNRAVLQVPQKGLICFRAAIHLCNVS